MTKKLYLDNTYLFESNALILFCNQDEKGNYVILDQTIFYPQGGGQPADHGIIKGDDFILQVVHVAQVGDEVRHYIKQPLEGILQNSQILCNVDKIRRISNAKYHTSGHLISNIVEKIYPHLKATKGHSFPGEAYVEFQGANGLIDQVIIEEALSKVIAENLSTRIFKSDLVSFENNYYKLPYQIPGNKDFRIMQIGDFLPVPCGGTHLEALGEIEKLALSKLKIKNDILRIAYSC